MRCPTKEIAFCSQPTGHIRVAEKYEQNLKGAIPKACQAPLPTSPSASKFSIYASDFALRPIVLRKSTDTQTKENLALSRLLPQRPSPIYFSLRHFLEASMANERQ
jgi:hypothetical protein